MREQSNLKQKLIVGFIAFIMIASIAGFLIGNTVSNQKINYNGFKMVQKGSVWTTELGEKEAVFNYFPSEVADIEVSPEIITTLANTLEIDVTSDPNSTYAETIALAVFELNGELDFHYNKFVRQGFITNTTFLPIITCEDATPAIPILFFLESNETKIYQNDSCIILEISSFNDAIRIKDRLLYGIHGIIVAKNANNNQ